MRAVRVSECTCEFLCEHFALVCIYVSGVRVSLHVRCVCMCVRACAGHCVYAYVYYA